MPAQNCTGSDPAARISFAAMQHEHLALMRRWLQAPHVRQWWGEPELDDISSTASRLIAERPTAEGHAFVIIDPVPANARAELAYEKAGFHAIPELIGRSGGSLIMRFEPQAGDDNR